ncbi:MAG: bifunctional diguanylate cyclase/phosphodiesterase [Actinomycetota bacterium]|nr:bifunctional diguanylate cyclase/phosphodiesterase [Actinomycetota bacterium]
MEPRGSIRALAPEDGHEGSEPRRRRLLAGLGAILVCLGVAGSVFAGWRWRDDVRAQGQQSFHSTAAAVASALALALQRDNDLTSMARTLVQDNPAVGNATFERWFELLLGARGDFPGTFGLVYVEHVPAGRLARFARTVASDPPLGLPEPGPFAVTPKRQESAYCLTRAGVVQVSGDVHLPAGAVTSILAFARPDLNYCALPIGALLTGSSMAAQPTGSTLARLLRAIPAGSNVPQLPASATGQLAKSNLLLTATPVYSTRRPPRSPAARLDATRGWILTIYEADDILAPSIAARREQAAVLSFTNPGTRTTVSAASGTAAPDTLTAHFHLMGPWSVALAAPATTAALSATDQGLAVIGIGLALSLLILLFFVVLSRSRARALQLVELRTAQLRHQALHDDLTGLPNRALVFDRAEQLLSRARRERRAIAALFVDIDQFKDVNDSLGHGAGDELLREVAQRFVAVAGEFATIGRLGGDEFVILFEQEAGTGSPSGVADQLVAAMAAPFRLAGQTTAVSASIGIAIGAPADPEALLRDADIALYEAKLRARGGAVTFQPAMRASVARRLELELELREAARTRQFFLEYQPIFDLDTLQVSGVEALVRWQHPTRGTVMPAEFITTLEATGLIVEVGRFLLEEACRQAASWRRAGDAVGVAVNASSRQLERDDFVDSVAHALRASGLDPAALTIEITETTLMRNPERAAARLKALKRIGINVAIDDFGTGYSSLAYLQQFPVDVLKIDRSFVSRLDTNDGAALVRTILQLGRDLSLKTLAEGIETPAQLEQLHREGCAAGQGFLLARPCAPGLLAQLLSDGAIARAHFLESL